MTVGWILAAVGLDLVLGDPQVRWHPVRLAGAWIAWLEKILRNAGCDGTAGGILLVALALIGAGLPVVGLMALDLNPVLEFIAGTVTLYFSIALGSLLREGQRIRLALEGNRIEEARVGVRNLCGRDVNRLDGAGITRATIESVAENSVDGYASPLFYAALFGPAGAWLYRIANTLDSMVGYKNEKYLRFGWAAARLDDLLNFVPARITAVLISLWSPAANGAIRDGLRSMWVFAKLHPSPNAGWTESAAAGALGIRLGGPASYFGKVVDKPYLGDGDRGPVPADIRAASRLVVFAGLTYVLILSLAVSSFRS